MGGIFCCQHRVNQQHHNKQVRSLYSFLIVGGPNYDIFIYLIVSYSVSKKTHLKEMCDFLTLKMLPLALALIKTKNCHLFDPLVKNCPFQWEILSRHPKLKILI